MSRNLDLFPSSSLPPRSEKGAPLAERLRPVEWERYQLAGAFDPVFIDFLRKGEGIPPSLVLWGPPGSGKTTLARLIGRSFRCHFVQLSAVLSGVKEVREIVETARKLTARTLLFVDEIHRFNKAQQDAFLPHIEDGTIVLIGATTENPSFYLTTALLSRVKVLVLSPLSAQALENIFVHAEKELDVQFDSESRKMLQDFAGGDARRLLNSMEGLVGSRGGTVKHFDGATVRDYLKKTENTFYDRSGEEHYNYASAFIKSMRGSDPDAALYWGFRMLESGEDPRFLFRRLVIFASEDVGNADPRGVQLAVACAEAFERVGMPEGRIPLAQCITYLASVPKSNRSYQAMHRVLDSIKKHPRVTVPLHLRNAPTKLMESLGYGAEYQYPHDQEEGFVHGVRYLPDELGDVRFYEPSEHGQEAKIAERLRALRPRKE